MREQPTEEEHQAVREGITYEAFANRFGNDRCLIYICHDMPEEPGDEIPRPQTS